MLPLSRPAAIQRPKLVTSQRITKRANGFFISYYYTISSSAAAPDLHKRFGQISSENRVPLCCNQYIIFDSDANAFFGYIYSRLACQYHVSCQWLAIVADVMNIEPEEM